MGLGTLPKTVVGNSSFVIDCILFLFMSYSSSGNAKMQADSHLAMFWYVTDDTAALLEL